MTEYHEELGVNAQSLKASHLEEIVSPRARDLYERLERACLARDGLCDDACLTLIADAARGEQIKEMLLKDIAERGLGSTYKNYRQSYYKPNESVKEIRAVMDQQRRILKELRLTPASRNADSVTVDDGFGDF